METMMIWSGIVCVIINFLKGTMGTMMTQSGMVIERVLLEGTFT